MKKKGVNAIMRHREQFMESNTEGCTPGQELSSIMREVDKRKSQLGRSYYVAAILARGSCRVSEVLAIKSKDIVDSVTVYVHGSKRSRDKLVVVPECKQLFTQCIQHDIKPFFMLTRRVVWSNFKKCGLYIKSEDKANASVTHMFRHLTADKVRSLSANENSVRDVLGHNSNKSQKYYGKEKRF